MIFEASGRGTARFDAVTNLESPDAMITLRTQLTDEPALKSYALALLTKLTTLWQCPQQAALRMIIYPDQVSESCYMIILDTVDHATFTTKALAVYRSVLAQHGHKRPQPPITHDVCFLPSGHTVQYQGRD